MRAANPKPRTNENTEAGQWLRIWNRWANATKSPEYAAETNRLTWAMWMPKTTTPDPWLTSQGQC